MANGTGPAITGRDRVGQALRDVKGSADVRLGVIAGAATLGITWLGTFILGLIPIPILGFTVMSPASEAGGPFNYRWCVGGLEPHEPLWRQCARRGRRQREHPGTR